jgi:hypothetical protein
VAVVVVGVAFVVVKQHGSFFFVFSFLKAEVFSP